MALKKVKWLKYLFVSQSVAQTEQDYWDKKRKKHMSREHTPGVVSGLEVTEISPGTMSVYVNPGRALDTEGNDPELENAQEINCEGMVPEAGTQMVYITLSYQSIETDPYHVDETGEFQNTYIQDSVLLQAKTDLPSGLEIELARINLDAWPTAIRNAADPANPQVNEIDLRFRMYSGKEVLAFRDLADVDQNEADAFNAMSNASGQNPIATLQDVDDKLAPITQEVAAARGSLPNLDARLDIMLNEDGSFRGITDIQPTAPLHGGGSSGPITIGISNASPMYDGAMSAQDKQKLDAIEPGATADQTAQEILDLIKTVDGAGSGLDADLLDGAPHRGSNGLTEHAAATGAQAGFMSAGDKTKLDGIESGATADLTAQEIVNLLVTSGLLNLEKLADVSANEAAAFNAAGAAGATGANRLVLLSDLTIQQAVYA